MGNSRNKMAIKSIGLLQTNINENDSEEEEIDPRQMALDRQEELNEIERQYMNLDSEDDDPNDIYARAERKGKPVNFDLMTSPFLI